MSQPPATPNPNQIDAATAACGKAIEQAVEKFVDNPADAIEKCLLAWQKCDTATELEDADACKAALLVVDGGKCAKGKLGPPNKYFGPGSSIAGVDDSAIAKALNHFIAALAAKCPVDGSVDYSRLGVTSLPTSDVELYETLNADPTGAPCNAHKRVKVTFPSRDTVITEMFNHPDWTNFPIGVGSIINPFGNCK